jgi:hypothetical protein
MTLNITNLDRLISHLEGLPEERFNMGYVTPENHCGSACCIEGHGSKLFEKSIANALNILDGTQYSDLIMPKDWVLDQDGIKRYPLSRAIRTLKHMRAEFLRTGQVVVDWDAPEPAARKDWVAPQAVERVLPAEITKLLGTPVYSEVL